MHLMVFFKVNLGPKVASVIKKSEKKNSMVVNEKKLSLKVMTNSLKMAGKKIGKN